MEQRRHLELYRLTLLPTRKQIVKRKKLDHRVIGKTFETESAFSAGRKPPSTRLVPPATGAKYQQVGHRGSPLLILEIGVLIHVQPDRIGPVRLQRYRQHTRPYSERPKRPSSELMPLVCTVFSMTPTATTYAHLLGEATHPACDGSTRSVLHDSSYAKPRC